MQNRFCTGQYWPTWLKVYNYISTTSISSATISIENDGFKVYEGTKILYSSTTKGPVNTRGGLTLSMELYDPVEIEPVNGVYSLTGGKEYMFTNTQVNNEGYGNKFFYLGTSRTLTVSTGSATFSNRSFVYQRDYVNRRSSYNSQGSFDDPFTGYTEMDTSNAYFGYWCVAYRDSSNGNLITDEDLHGGVNYGMTASSSEELIGNVACAEVKFTTLSKITFNHDRLKYQVKYNNEDNWTKIGTFYLIEEERQDTGVWNYTYRDSCKDLDSNANRYIKLLNAGTDRYYHWNSYPLTETSTSGSITVNVNGAAICSYCSDSSSGIKNALTVNENNELRFTKPMNVIFKESKFNWLQYEGIRETLSKHISGPQGPYEDTYVTVSNSLNIEDGKQGTVSLGTVTSRVKVNYQNNPAYRWNEYVLGKYVKFDDDSNIYYACATATSHTEGGLIPDVYLDAPVVPIGYEFYEANYTDYDVPDTLNTLVVSHYDSQGNTYYNFDYYEPISICPLCYYTSPLLVAVNGNVYYSALREIVYDERGVNVIGIKINYSKQYTLGSPSDAYNSYIFYYPDYGWGGNYYYIRSKLPVASTPRALWNSVCKYLEITTDITNLPYEFLDYTLEGEYNEDHNTTYRNILSDIVQMCGGYGYVNVSNTFTIATYKEVDGALLDNTMYSNLTTRHTPIPVYNFFQVNLENQEDYMHYGMGTNIMYISNVLCTTSDKDTFLGSYFPRIAELFEEIDEWYKTEITLDRDYGLKPGDIISVEATYSDGTSETFRTLIISKTITNRGVVLSSLIGG